MGEGCRFGGTQVGLCSAPWALLGGLEQIPWQGCGAQVSCVQHHSSKASILPHSAFFTVHLSHPYMTTGKTIALTRLTTAANQIPKIMLICYRNETTPVQQFQLD